MTKHRVLLAKTKFTVTAGMTAKLAALVATPK